MKILEDKQKELKDAKQRIKDLQREIIKAIFEVIPSLESFSINARFNADNQIELSIEKVNKVDWPCFYVPLHILSPAQDLSESYRIWLIEVNLTITEFSNLVIALNDMNPEFFIHRKSEFYRENFIEKTTT